MICPSCGHKQKCHIECKHCGIIFAKFLKRQKHLAIKKKAVSVDPAPKSGSGLIVGLLIALVAGGLAFYYFNSSSQKTTEPPRQETSNIHEPQRDSRQLTKRQQAATHSPSSQFSENSLEGLAAQLAESHTRQANQKKGERGLGKSYVNTKFGNIHKNRTLFSGLAFCCVPGKAHVLKGEFIIATRAIMSKSQTQPDGGEGCSVSARGIRSRLL